jgi:hypothetical protein
MLGMIPPAIALIHALLFYLKEYQKQLQFDSELAIRLSAGSSGVHCLRTCEFKAVALSVQLWCKEFVLLTERNKLPK